MQPNIIKKAGCAGLAILIAISGMCTPDFYESTMPLSLYLTGNFADTIVPRKKPAEKKEYRFGNIDQALKEVDRAMGDLDKNIKIDFPDIEREIKAAMAEVKKIDVEVINREVKESIEKVDWQQIKKEISDALREANMEIDAVDRKEIREALEKAKQEIKAEKMNMPDMDNIKLHLNKDLAKARTGIEKAKKELTVLKEFTDNLEKDKLINKKKGYKIELKGSDLYINGTKQPKEVTDRYRKYFREKDYSVVSDGDSISAI